MENTNDHDVINDDASLIDTFHRVGSLIPKDQNLTTITRDTTVKEALKLMEERHFSQLPVVAGEAVLGVFSYRSFCKKAVERQRSKRNTVLAELLVGEFMEDFPYVPASMDWTKIQQQLDEKDGFFIGSPEAIDGLVTTMDVYQYFRSITDPFIYIAEIELTLRRLVAGNIPESEQSGVFNQVLKGKCPEGKAPTHVNDLTLRDLIHLVITRKNWGYFREVFGQDERARNRTNEKLERISDLRNDVFHFRRKLTSEDMEYLIDCRDWLHQTTRAFEGERKSNGSKSE